LGNKGKKKEVRTEGLIRSNMEGTIYLQSGLVKNQGLFNIYTERRGGRGHGGACKLSFLMLYQKATSAKKKGENDFFD